MKQQEQFDLAKETETVLKGLKDNDLPMGMAMFKQINSYFINEEDEED